VAEARLQLARPDELPLVQALLAGERLPTSDLDLRFPDGFVVARAGGELVGVAGLEIHGPVGLLRSLAVRPAERGSGLGRVLVEDRLGAARAQGLAAVFLLTTPAASYFRRLGFVDAERAAAPAELQASTEFRSLCPATAACLALRLR
jgi:amino-acid N-acetyltransferase